MIVGFLVAGHRRSRRSLRPELTIETLLIRALGAAAFTLLHVILCIGPLARLDRRFLPLLYNRRHLGVMMFTLALGHGVFSIVQFHALGTLNPLVSVLVSNQRYTTLGQLPFQPFGLAALVILFLMAATSHDFWLHNLTAPVWKTLHMGVYVAYTFIVLHVRVRRPAGRDQPAPRMDALWWSADRVHAARAGGAAGGAGRSREQECAEGRVRGRVSRGRDSREAGGRDVSVR